MDRRKAPALVAVLLALAAAMAPPAEAPAPVASPWLYQPDGKLFFALHIADEQGEVLAEPRLLGMCGVPLEMTLSEPGNLELPTMSLRLEPAFRSDGSYEIAFQLDVPGLAAHGVGTVRMRPGEEKRARVEYPGGHLDVQLAAFAVPSAEFQLYLQHGVNRHLEPTRT